MMKWLRKHTKQIMVVVVLLAMFSFVGGAALVGFLSPKQDQGYARIFGQEVTQRDLSPTQRSLSVLERLGIPWRFGGEGMGVGHWYMLTREAKEAGIVVTEEEIDKVMDGFMRQPRAAEMIDSLRKQQKFSMSEIRLAFEGYIAVRKNADRIGGCAMPSEPEVRHYARDTEEKIKIRYVPFNATFFVDRDTPVSEEVLQAQFEENRDFAPEDSATGFGYRHPKRVKLQYVIAKLQSIKPRIEVAPDEVATYWKANKAEYTRTEYVDEPAPPTSAPATTGPAATQPAPQPKKNRIERMMRFSEAQDLVKRDIQANKAKRIAEQAMRKVASSLLKPWYAVQTDQKTGFKPIPEIARDPDHLRSICERVKQEFGIPLDFVETPLLSAEQMGTWQDLRGVATAGSGAERLTISDFAFAIPLFMEGAHGESGSSLQLFQPPDAPMIGSSGMSYKFVNNQMVPVPGEMDRLVLFRVVEAAEAAPPASLDEVRADVERDARLRRAFDVAEPVAKEFYSVARRLGIEKTMTLFEDSLKDKGVRKVTEPEAFARRTSLAKLGGREEYRNALVEGLSTVGPSTVSGIGSSETFVDACFELADGGYASVDVDVPTTERIDRATTQPASTPPPVVRLLPLPKLGKWFVIELVDLEWIDDQKYNSELREQAFQMLMQERAAAVTDSWFDTDSIEKRCGFEQILDEESPPDTDEGVQRGGQSEPSDS
ncbi:MAG: hypothetical protein ABII12_15945 [Planctomycetota bacterium]